MPFYNHECPDCGHQTSEFRKLEDWDACPECPICGVTMPHFLKQISVRGNYKKKVRLESMGFLATAEDVSEHRRRFPDVELAFDNGSAIPVMASRSQKKAYLKKSGWIDAKSYD